jgi:hypothetical protein
LLATSVYVVVAVGETIRDPLALTADPFSVTLVAFELDHCSVELWPLWIDIGIALISAVGIGNGAGFTVTVVVSVTEPAELLATRV